MITYKTAGIALAMTALEFAEF